MIAVDAERGRARLSVAAARNRELWAFLSLLHHGQLISGTVAAIERFGVFVALDVGPRHPVFPSVGFISMAELSWHRFDSATDVVQVGRQVSCAFLQFDTSYGGARLSLKALQPDPFRSFLDQASVGQILRGTVTKLAPFGASIRVADGVEGLVHLQELAAPAGTLRVGDKITVTVTGIDRERRQLILSQRALPVGSA